MKQKEKNEQSQEKILNAALQEFGEKGYDGASLNTLLSEHGISKGLFYHYFENKDSLYLACAKACMDPLTQVLSRIDTTGDVEAVLKTYFQARASFFMENPLQAQIFFGVLLQPPAHLSQELADIRRGFETVNRSLFQSVLCGLPLREGMSEADALYYFELIQNAVQFQFSAKKGQDTQEAPTVLYERQARMAVEILLYGLIGRA